MRGCDALPPYLVTGTYTCCLLLLRAASSRWHHAVTRQSFMPPFLPAFGPSNGSGRTVSCSCREAVKSQDPFAFKCLRFESPSFIRSHLKSSSKSVFTAVNTSPSSALSKPQDMMPSACKSLCREPWAWTYKAWSLSAFGRLSVWRGPFFLLWGPPRF